MVSLSEPEDSNYRMAEAAYVAYAEHQNWKNYAGNPIPQWFDVRQDIKDAWVAAADEVQEKLADWYKIV